MTMNWLRGGSISAAVLVLVAGCQEKYEMVTAALDSVSASEVATLMTGSASEASSGATEGTTENTGEPTTTNATNTTTSNTSNTSNTTNTTPGTTTDTTTTGTTTWDPTATTDPPVPCEGPEDCTTEGMGDLTTFVLPFFRGEVCVSDTFRAGDMMALSVDPCVHPCLDPAKYGWRYIIRCTGGVGCEMAFMLYYRETVGGNCPSDVFGKFDEGLCQYYGPHKALTSPLMSFGYPEDKLVIPFLTNEDATAVSMMEPNVEVWKRIDGHGQAADRYFPLSVSDQNPAPPMECGPGVPGCTCQKIGF